MRLVVADQRPNGGVRDHHLHCERTTASARQRKQLLTEDGLDHEGELRAHLLLLVGWEHVDDAVDRLHRVGGVQRAEGEVARLGDRQGGLDRLHVAHLTDEDHIGVLTKRTAQRTAEGLSVGSDFALVE